MSDNRQICANCIYYKAFHGVMECWNRESDSMYRPTLPDDDCDCFERKEGDSDELE